MTKTTLLTAGIDTAKAKLDVAIHGRTEAFVVANMAAGWKDLADRLAQLEVQRVGIEASGGYERGVILHLRDVGFIIVLLQPNQVRVFAKMRLQRAKNDRIDAALIAACADLLDDCDKPPPDPRLGAMADRLTSVEQAEEDNRLWLSGHSADGRHGQPASRGTAHRW